MENTTIKNILIIALALFIIMVVSTIIVVGFNYLVGFSTDVNNDNVATSIAIVAFVIGVAIKLIIYKKEVN